MRSKTLVWSLAIVAVLVAVLVWGLRTVTDEATFVIAFVGLLANLVMAGAAAWAFRTWREQLRGEARPVMRRRTKRPDDSSIGSGNSATQPIRLFRFRSS